MTKLQNIQATLSGKKTIIGIVAGAVYSAVIYLHPELNNQLSLDTHRNIYWHISSSRYR